MEPFDALEVHWPFDRTLRPEIFFFGEVGAAFDDVEIDADLGAAYEWLDACAVASERGELPPPAGSVLLPAQRASLTVLAEQWPAIQEALAAHFPADVRPHLEWGSVRVSTDEQGGHVYVELGGFCAAPFENPYEEHGVGAVLLGADVLAAGDRDVSCPRPAIDRPQPEPRPHPEHVDLSTSDVQGYIAGNDWEGLLGALSRSLDVAVVDGAVLDWWWTLPDEQAIDLLPALAPFLLPRATDLGPRELDADPARVAALVRLGRFAVPADILFRVDEEVALRRWVALGAPVNAPRQGGAAWDTPLMAHKNDPGRFEALLELGADPAPLFDEFGTLVADLGLAQLSALREYHPERFATAAEPAASRDVLTDWLSLGWIELEEPGAHGAVSAALSDLLDLHSDAEALVNALFDVPGVAEVYVDDDTLERFMRAW